MGVQGRNPAKHGRTETNVLQGRPHKLPIDPGKWFLGIYRKQKKWAPGGLGHVNNVKNADHIIDGLMEMDKGHLVSMY